MIICFSSFDIDSTDYLTIKDQLDVGMLSHRMIFQLVSKPLQSSVCFFQPPKLIVRLRFLHRFTCVHHTNYLVLIRLRDYQKGMLLTINTPHADACFAPLSGSLFIQIPRFTEWHRWFSMLLF
jgi:hypothetical protein